MSYFNRFSNRALAFSIIVLLFVAAVGTQLARNLNREVVTVGVVQYAPVSNILTQGFKQGMEEMGYEEGKDIEYIIKESTLDEAIVKKNAEEVVTADVDIIFVTTSVGAVAVLDATKEAGRTDIPIVWTHAVNAVALGLAENYKSSGNNSTGVEISFQDLTRKKFDFLLRIDPSIEKIGIFEPVAQDFATFATLPVVKEEAPKYGISLVTYPVESEVDTQAFSEISSIIQTVEPGVFDAYIYIPGPSIAGESLDLQVDMTKRLGVPSFWLTQDEVIKGGLFTYEYDNIEMGKQSAVQADKILRGVKPSDIPIEPPNKVSLIMNFKTADEMGLEIPEDIRRLVDIEINE